MDQQAQANYNSTLVQKVTVLLESKPVILQILRFGAIGVLNTALDFLVLNAISKAVGITGGLSLGLINAAGFVLAMVQSYFWNKYWAFGEQAGVSLWKNFVRLVLVGVLGAVGMALVLVGATVNAFAGFYVIVLSVFVLLQVVLWGVFGLPWPGRVRNGTVESAVPGQFWLFVGVSIVGLVINSGLVGLITSQFILVDNADLNKNLAKIVATVASLVWNFIGYKLFVFKK